jgi:PAS domain S-box-containing protein
LSRLLQRREFEYLKEAFDSFNDATERLQVSYAELEKQVHSLNLELENKNRELEENLHEKEKVKNYLNHILESLSNGVVVVDKERKVTIINQAAEEMFNLDAETIIGRPVDTIACILPLDLDHMLLQSTADKRPNELIEVNQKDGAMYISLSVAPLLAGEDDFQGTILIIQDVSRLKRLEEKENRRNRLMAMGEMAASIAHEIRNPLGSIELLASLLKRELNADGDKKSLAQQIVSGVKHLDNVVSNLLLFTRHGRLNLQLTDLHGFIVESMSMVRYAIDQNGINLDYQFQEAAPCVWIDRQLIQQVLFNLILNAVQAMPQGGMITVSSRTCDNWVEVGVSDTGSGIPKDHQDAIFNPFFTTKDRGMGLGLAIVHNIIEAHSGSIEVESVPGQGTRLIFSIPLSRENGKEHHG